MPLGKAVEVEVPQQREPLAARASLDLPSNSLLQGKERGAHTDALPALWEEMTMVRRSAPEGAEW